MQIVQVDTMDMLSLSILVLFLGMFLNRKIKVLGDNYIPPALPGDGPTPPGLALGAPAEDSGKAPRIPVRPP